MNHDEVLISHLAGDSLPLEAVSHLANCPNCRAEIEALRAVEGSVAAAAPVWAPKRGVSAGSAGYAIARKRAKLGREFLALAASLALCACLAGALSRPPETGGVNSMGPARLGAGADFGFVGLEDGTLDILDACQAQFEVDYDDTPEDFGGYLGDPGNGG